MMLICHLSDLHIRAPGQLAYGRVDTAAHLQRCVAHIAGLTPRPDAVVVTGDLTDRGEPEEYEHLLSLLAPLSPPVYVIPGNHDNRALMRKAFADHSYLKQSDEFLQYRAELGPLRLVGLDTVVPGEGGGQLCKARLAWLEKQLLRYRSFPVVILMHHPPFETGIRFMDAVGLHAPDPFEALISAHPNVERVLCGHVHRTILRRFGGTIAITCPSPAHQVTLDFAPEAQPGFSMEPPGYLLHRWIDSTGITTYTAVIGDYEGPYPFYDDPTRWRAGAADNLTPLREPHATAPRARRTRQASRSRR
jgi:3',5'-cyclic AMP phosphodiesterase CpdA